MNIQLLLERFTWSALDSRVKSVSSAARLTDDMVCLKKGQTRGTRTVRDCCMLNWTHTKKKVFKRLTTQHYQVGHNVVNTIVVRSSVDFMAFMTDLHCRTCG